METAAPNAILEKGLPANVEAEQFVLGSVLLDDSVFPQLAGTLSADDFILEKHRTIFLQHAAHPRRVAPVSSFSMDGWDDPDWQRR